MLSDEKPVEPEFVGETYLPFLSCFAAFFSLGDFAGAFLVCFFEFWVLAMFLYVLRLLFDGEHIEL